MLKSLEHGCVAFLNKKDLSLHGLRKMVEKEMKAAKAGCSTISLASFSILIFCTARKATTKRAKSCIGFERRRQTGS